MYFDRKLAEFCTVVFVMDNLRAYSANGHSGVTICLPIMPPLRCLRFGNLVACLEPDMY